VVVGEFEACAGGTTSGSRPVAVRCMTPVGKTAQGKFAMETSCRALKYYSDFFDVAYPLPKYDCIAIPDFQCGAMENWVSYVLVSSVSVIALSLGLGDLSRVLRAG